MGNGTFVNRQQGRLFNADLPAGVVSYIVASRTQPVVRFSGERLASVELDLIADDPNGAIRLASSTGRR